MARQALAFSSAEQRSKPLDAARLVNLADRLDRIADARRQPDVSDLRRDANYLRSLAALSRSTSTGK